MTDIVSREERSRMMSRIGNRNTAPEKAVRSMLHSMGYRFRLNVKTLPGNPDIFLPRHNLVIFVHGCFWHRHTGCKYAYNPKTRVEFWKTKFEKNVLRDLKVEKELATLKMRRAIVWECEISETEKLQKRLRRILENSSESC